MEKGVPLISKYNYLYLPLPPSSILLTVFTPLSTRRGVGGEAFLHLQTTVFTPLSIRRGGGGEASPPLWGGWVDNLKPIAPLEETNLLEFFLHTCFLFIGHVLEGNTVWSEVETEQFHDALTAYDVTTEVTDNIDHCL